MSQTILEQVHRFLDWAAKKVQIHFSQRGDIYFEECEVWWASLGENVGAEINGKNFHFERPVAILKKFSGELLFVAPLISSLKNGSWFQPVHIDGRENRAVLVQVRTISSRRLIRKIGNISYSEFMLLQERVISLIKTEPPMGFGGSSDPLARTICV